MEEYTLGQQVVLKRWKLMAESDLGYMVQPIARDLYAFFEKAFALHNFWGDNVQFDCLPYEEALPLLRGYAWTEDDDFNVVETHDLHYISMSDSAASLDNLDYWLMNDKDWASRYRYTLELQEAAKKVSKKRRNRK